MNNRHNQEIKELKTELEKSDIKDKNEVLKKTNELNELNNKHVKEKQIMEQEVNKKNKNYKIMLLK